MIKQKDAVYNAVVSVKGTSTFSGPVELTKEERQSVSTILFNGFKSNEIVLSSEMADDKELTSYISGLVSNWLRKDTRLSGGIAYVPKNPGSRAGSGDETLKAMRALLSVTTDPNDRAEIQGHIDARVTELKPRKTVDFSALPESLRHLVQQ